MSSLTTTDRLKELLPQLFNTEKLEGDYYLRFQLTDSICGLIELKYVRESLMIEGNRLSPLPNLPNYVVGLMSSKNEVFLAIDLAHLVGLPPQTVNLRQYPTIVVRVDEKSSEDRADEINLYGLTVKSIMGISRILPQEFTSVTEIPDALRDFVRSAAVENIDSHQYSFLIDISKLIITKTKL